jgi:conjugative relaxase-like TrwC/TraI family protein
MLRVVAHTSAAAARNYYAEGLKREDYYSKKQEVVGKWHGKAAGLLGLSGDVDKDQFAALAENRHPVSGAKLTPRTKDGRRVGYDLNFHAPKSLSVLYALTQDKDVLKAFRSAVSETMTELEERAETRVRKKGAQANRVTGNLAWAEFVHFTSRPVGGIPDPHLHVHCFTFNATFDQVEARWKAAEFGAIKREAHYGEAAFHARLTTKLSELGYGIERRKGGWEIKGMPASVIAKFSRRTAQIERLADEMGITDAKSKDALGAASREGKRHGLSFPDLLAAWSVRLTDDEKVQISKVCYDKGQGVSQRVTAAEAVDYAIAKLFERQSVVERGHILAEALKFGVGHTAPAAIKAEFERRQLIGRKIGDEHLCTSVDVLAEEVALLAFVRGGRNAAMPLGGRGKLAISEKLSEEQRAAVKHLLTSRDQVMAVRGGAGVGKTTLMKEACAAIERQGMKVFAFAPSAVASRETLREAGFAGADTVAHLMLNTKLQKQVQGQVIWVDEAGLLGVRDLWHIMEIAGPSTRVILTGDTAQHAPVARGDAFRILQKHAGLRVAEVTEIRRQEIEDYKQAIAAISKGDLRSGFRRLESLGAFIEIADEAKRYRELAADYIALGRRGEFPLVVSPTHAESAKVTNAIRDARREIGQLGPERRFVQYQNLQWEVAERSLPENYRAGLLVQFHQNAKGITRGELFRVVGQAADGRIEIENRAGQTRTLPLGEAKKFLVYEEREIALAKGDRIRITQNGQSENGKRLNNGNTFTVEKFSKKGELVLNNGAVLAPDHGHLAYGYCQTSHSSQSKSVRDVLVAQSADSFVASSREQFYVSCSRGKETIRIYTDNRQGLQQAVGNSSTRMAGVELLGLNQGDLDTFMSSELGAKQWRDTVASRRGLDKSKTFVQNIVDQRRLDPYKKEETMDWRGYIEMRRNMVSADGKNRSKGHPSGTTKGKTGEKGKSWPKLSQHTKPVRDELAAAHEAKKAATASKSESATKPKTVKPESQGRTARLVNAYRSAASHFKKVADKVKGKQVASDKQVSMGGAKVKPLQKGNSTRAAEHAAKEKAASVRKTGEGQAKMARETKGKQAAPRAPTPKK